MKRFLLRLVLGLALAAVALYPLYLIAGNWYLRSGDLERRLNRRPERLLIQVGSAWTSWPGVIHVRDFRIRNQTVTNQWWASVDRGSFTIRLFDLRDRQLIIDGLSGSGVSFRLRRRVDNPRWVRKPRPELQPSIPGLANPPVRPPEKIYPRPPQRPGQPRRDPWRIRLAQVDLDDVREIWIDEIRFAGEARVAGGFDMQTWRRLQIDTTRMQIVSGSISLGALGAGPQARPILLDVRGHVDGEISPYSPAEHHGWQSIRFLTGRAKVEGSVPSLAFLDEYLRSTRWLALEGEGGRIAADLRVRRGRLLPGSRMDARQELLAARVLDYRAYGPGRIAWEVLPDQSGRLGLDFGAFQVIREGYRQPHVRGRGLHIEARTEEPKLAGLALFSPRSFDIKMPAAEVPSLACYNAYLPAASGLKLTGGSGRISADFKAAAPEWVGHGNLRLDARGISAVVEGRPLQGDVLLQTQLREADFRGRHFDISGTKLDVTRVRIAGMAGGANWWARAHLDRAVLEPGSPVLLRARVESTISDPRPIFAFVAPPERRSRLLDWMDRLLDVQGIGAVADVSVGTGGVAIDHMAIAGGPALVQGRLRIGGPRPQGILYASYGRWDVGLEMDGGQRDWKILKPKQWFANQMVAESRIPSR